MYGACEGEVWGARRKTQSCTLKAPRKRDNMDASVRRFSDGLCPFRSEEKELWSTSRMAAIAAPSHSFCHPTHIINIRIDRPHAVLRSATPAHPHLSPVPPISYPRIRCRQKCSLLFILLISQPGDHRRGPLEDIPKSHVQAATRLQLSSRGIPSSQRCCCGTVPPVSPRFDCGLVVRDKVATLRV